MEQQQTELRQENANTLPSQEQQPIGQQPYHAPALVCYGELAALVQGNPNNGPDANSYPDCTHS